MRIFSSILSLFIAALVKAESGAELFYSNGKAYVVVGVLLIIFTGIILYLFRLDRKISKLEKENEA